VTFTATVSAVAPSAGTATGTVTFLDGAATLGTASLSAGSATLTTVLSMKAMLEARIAVARIHGWAGVGMRLQTERLMRSVREE